MIILGIDPGSRIMGYGLIEHTGNKSRHIDNGGIYTSEKAPLAEKLLTLGQGVQSLIDKFKPEVLSIEEIFYGKNVKSLIKLGHARGAIMLTAALNKLPVFEYSPLFIKQAVAGFGRAEKEQVGKMVKVLLNLPQVAEENASDALAAAICHAHSHKMAKLTAKK